MTDKNIIEARVNVLDIIDEMKRILDKGIFHIETFNTLVDCIILISEKIHFINININMLDTTANKMLEIVEIISKPNTNFFYNEISTRYKELIEIFENLYREIESKLIIKILIFDSRNVSSYISNLFNRNVKIVAHIKGDRCNKAKLYIKEKAFDLILIINNNSKKINEEFSMMGVPKDKIFDFFQYVRIYIDEYNNYHNENYYHAMLSTRMKKIKKRNHFQGVLSGLSYALRGFVEKESKKNTLKLAFPSQDLFYDYKIMKELLESGVEVEHWLMGLAYYSFDWDLSLTKQESNRIESIYYPIFNDSHNLQIGEKYPIYKGIDNVLNKINPLFTTLFKEDAFNCYIEDVLGVDLTPDFNEDLWESGTYLNTNISKIKESDRYKLGKERAEFHNKLFYPATTIENKKIFKDMLELLKKYQVKPVLIVFPTTPYYYHHVSNDTKKRFYNIIDEFSVQYDFQMIDMFKSEQFNMDDFVDWDHLNKKGAYKMTSILNEVINW
ncbi:hypothetical protein JYA63_08070 [Fictibacillus nanhaiensis]|uniref:Uncharacterized protein n=1 Tax=Fictibacillus nanhaiensis TaxID=742169 RepID=A0ABS2ZQB4_9BACL|nr:hypothetical protein [Fictibacillus nanhaiensis]